MILHHKHAERREKREGYTLSRRCEDAQLIPGIDCGTLYYRHSLISEVVCVINTDVLEIMIFLEVEYYSNIINKQLYAFIFIKSRIALPD